MWCRGPPWGHIAWSHGLWPPVLLVLLDSGGETDMDGAMKEREQGDVVEKVVGAGALVHWVVMESPSAGGDI